MMKNFDFKRYLIALNDCNKLKLKSLAIKVTMLSLCILGFSTLLSEPVIVQLLTLSICFLTIGNPRFTEKSKLSTEVSQPPFTAKERLLAQATHLFIKNLLVFFSLTALTSLWLLLFHALQLNLNWDVIIGPKIGMKLWMGLWLIVFLTTKQVIARSSFTAAWVWGVIEFAIIAALFTWLVMTFELSILWILLPFVTLVCVIFDMCLSYKKIQNTQQKDKISIEMQ